MSISFHCEHCGKKIEAPDNAGGKWGKCPACRHRVYVPGPGDEQEEIKLAPVDEQEERKRKELLAEETKFRTDILKESDIPDDTPEKPQQTVAAGGTLSDTELNESIITYLRLMADGELDQAEDEVSLITACGSRAIEILDRIALSEIPEPALSDVPPQVLSGLIRNLRSRIGRT